MEKTTSEEKSRLRQKFRQIRTSIVPDVRDQWDKSIASHVLALPEVERARSVFVYLSRTGEVDTSRLVQRFLAQHKRVLTPSPDISALPHDGLFRVTPRPNMDGHFPPVLCQESRVEQVDIVLVPGIIWDKSGYRVGFGGGYFDRLLSMVRPDCFRIGLAYECQLIEQVPREPWDERVDLVVTEAGQYHPEPEDTL